MDNWKTQIRKGYLELCILLLIRSNQKLYGFEIIERLSEVSLDVKEGTIYPILNRMAADAQLESRWETENVKGHPRKFYSLTKAGERLLNEMVDEFENLIRTYKQLGKT